MMLKDALIINLIQIIEIVFFKSIITHNSLTRSTKGHLKKLINKKITSWILFLMAVGDASLLPTPVTTFFLITISTNRKKSIEYIIMVTSGILIGGIIAYFSGRFFWFDQNNDFSEIARFLLRNIPGFNITSYFTIQSLFTKWDFWILFFASFTPLPFGLFALSSGAFHINPMLFILTVLFSNLIKFAFLSLITSQLEEKIRRALTPSVRRIT